jgi:hypothetical protein
MRIQQFLSCFPYLMESEGSLPCSQKLAIHPCIELEVSSTLRLQCEMYYHRTHRFWIQLAVCFLPPQGNKYLPPPCFRLSFFYPLLCAVCNNLFGRKKITPIPKARHVHTEKAAVYRPQQETRTAYAHAQGSPSHRARCKKSSCVV